MTKLNLGCGPIQPKSWDNVDGSNRAWLASKFPWIDRLLVRIGVLKSTEFNSSTIFANLNKRLPWEDDSVDSIYLGEVLEHFTLSNATAFIKECYRVLKPLGILRCRVPDNYRFWNNYVNEYNLIFNRPKHQWDDEHTKWIGMFFRDICVSRRVLGSFGHYHKWMYDEVSLTILLKGIGFNNIERRDFLDSRIVNIADVETHEDLTIEAVK